SASRETACPASSFGWRSQVRWPALGHLPSRSIGTEPARDDTSAAVIGIVMGSASDLGVMRHTGETLDAMQVPYEIKILSAHRTPDQVHEWASSAKKRGLRVIIAAAGGAAHLAGVVAANTLLPVL